MYFMRVNGIFLTPFVLFTLIVADIESIIFATDSYNFVFHFSSLGSLTCKDAYNYFRVQSPKVAWSRDVWCHYLSPSRSFLTWRILHGKLPTSELLWCKGLVCHLVVIFAFVTLNLWIMLLCNFYLVFIGKFV